MTDPHTKEGQDHSRDQYAPLGRVELVKADHVGGAEGGVGRQHVQNAKDKAGNPFPFSPVVVPADQQGDHKGRESGDEKAGIHQAEP